MQLPHIWACSGDNATIAISDINTMTTAVPRIAILTGGGDCPGLNAAVRGVARAALNQFDAEVIGIEDGFEGLVNGRLRALVDADV